jgi:hypothetical protein
MNQDNETDKLNVMNCIVEYLASEGADVTATFNDPGPNNDYVRYAFENRPYLVGVTSEAEHILRHWSAADIEGLLHNYRMASSSEKLHEHEFFVIRSSDAIPAPGTTYLDRGIVIAVREKADFGVR